MRYFQAYTQYEVAWWEMHLYHSCTEFKCSMWYSKIKLFLLSFLPNLVLSSSRMTGMATSSFKSRHLLNFPCPKNVVLCKLWFLCYLYDIFYDNKKCIRAKLHPEFNNVLSIQVCFLSVTFMQQLLSHISMSSQQE